jgi:adenosylcobinamide-GDP ribazoletransferase
MGLSRQMHAAITAAQFLTRAPVPGGMNRPDADRTLLRDAVVYFPLVGGVIGAFTGGVAWAAMLVWPPAVAVVVAIAAEALLTGAFHEDAVADCCDAFGGGWSSEDVLRILKDSRVGSYGALGLTLVVLLRGACLASIPPGELVVVVAASAAVGRWAILVMMAAAPPVPDREGLSKDVGQQAGVRDLLLGTLTAVPGAAWFAWSAPARAGLGVAAVVIVVLLWASYVQRRIGGVTGDCLGCGCYLGQCVVLLAAVAARGAT